MAIELKTVLTSQTEDTSPDVFSDFVLTYDASVSSLKKAKLKNLVGDGDKGDITVSESGTSWTIESGAVSYSKIQNISATDKLLGRSSAGAGTIEEIACTAAGRALLDDVDAAAQRTTLGLGSFATQSALATGTSITGGGASRVLFQDSLENLSTSSNFIFDPVSKRLGLGTSPEAGIHFMGTGEQLRLAHDSSNYMSATVSSAGAVTFNATGSQAGFLFSDPVTISGAVSATNISESAVTLDHAFIQSSSVNLSGPTADQILVNLSASTYKSARYLIQISEGSDVHVTEVRVFHDGTNCYLTEYGVMHSGNTLATFAVEIQDGNLRLLTTPTTGTKSYKVLTQALKA